MSVKRTIRVLCVFVCLVVTGVVSGCTPTDSRPIPNLIPDVVWPEGEPTGPLESDPWVQALREYALVTGAARLSLNYSDPALLTVATEEYLVPYYPQNNAHYHLSETNKDSYSFTRVPLGPMSFLPLEVNLTSGSTADVVVCIGFEPFVVDGKTYVSTNTPALPLVYMMELGDDGFRRVYDSRIGPFIPALPGSEREGGLGTCEGGGWTDLIKPALFSPLVDEQAWWDKGTEAIHNTPEVHYVPPLGVEWVDPGSLQGRWDASWKEHHTAWVFGFIVVSLGVIAGGGLFVRHRWRRSVSQHSSSSTKQSTST